MRPRRRTWRRVNIDNKALVQLIAISGTDEAPQGFVRRGVRTIGEHHDTFSTSCDRSFVNVSARPQSLRRPSATTTVTTRSPLAEQGNTAAVGTGGKPELQRRVEQWRHSDHRAVVRRGDLACRDGDRQRLAVRPGVRPLSRLQRPLYVGLRTVSSNQTDVTIGAPLLLSQGRLAFVVFVFSPATAARRRRRCARRSAMMTGPRPEKAQRARCRPADRGGPAGLALPIAFAISSVDAERPRPPSVSVMPGAMALTRIFRSPVLSPARW